MSSKLSGHLLQQGSPTRKGFVVVLALLGAGVLLRLSTHTLQADTYSRDTHFVYATAYLNQNFPGASSLYTCLLCHLHDNPDIDPADAPVPDDRNPYGERYEAAKVDRSICQGFQANQEQARLLCVLEKIEGDDPDLDHFTDREELLANKFPGNVDSKPQISIALTMTPPPAPVIVNQPTHFDFVLKNTGEVTLHTITITGPIPDCSASVSNLLPGNQTSATCTVVLTASLTNVTASAVGQSVMTATGLQQSNAVSVNVIERAPAVMMTVVSNAPHVSVGERLALTINVSNTGNVDLSTIVVDLPRTPVCNHTIATLAVHAQHFFPCTVTVSQDFVEAINGKNSYVLSGSVTGIDSIDHTPVTYPLAVEFDASAYMLLPLIVTTLVQQPDLVVDAISVTPQDLSIVIKNKSSATFRDVGYWVDLYINPTVVPTRVNQLATDWGGDGLVWGVDASTPPLLPGGTLTLHLGDSYYQQKLSRFPSLLAGGSRLYVQVDSANQNTSYGAVLEQHELIGDAYNNISVITLPEAISTASWLTERAASIEEASALLYAGAPRSQEAE